MRSPYDRIMLVRAREPVVAPTTIDVGETQRTWRQFGRALLEVGLAAAAMAMSTSSGFEAAKAPPREPVAGHVLTSIPSTVPVMAGKRAELLLRLQAPLQDASATLVGTETLLASDRFLDVNTAALGPDSALTALLLGDLPADTQALARMMLATSDSGPLVIALQGAVRDGVDGATRQASIRSALAKIVPYAAVKDVLTKDTSARTQQMLHGLEQLGPQSVYGGSLRTAVVAVVLSPQWSSLSSSERDQAIQATWNNRAAYMSVFQQFYLDDAGVPNATVTANECTVAAAAEFRLSAPVEGLQGCRHELTFPDGNGGKSISLLVPNPLLEQNLAVQDTARALALVPADVRQHIRTVVLNPSTNPEDGYWRTQPGYMADHRSMMSASAEKQLITIYPSQNSATGMLRARGLSVALLHEVGHLLQPKVVADEAWAAQWTKARASDDVRASDYAFSSDGEDFAETFAVYLSTRGTPSHDAYRLLMPQRFAVMDAVLPTLLALPPVSVAPSLS
jgi:hypothetical protein